MRPKMRPLGWTCFRVLQTHGSECLLDISSGVAQRRRSPTEHIPLLKSCSSTPFQSCSSPQSSFSSQPCQPACSSSQKPSCHSLFSSHTLPTHQHIQVVLLSEHSQNPILTTSSVPVCSKSDHLSPGNWFLLPPPAPWSALKTTVPVILYQKRPKALISLT